jgi:hypothetical protein
MPTLRSIGLTSGSIPTTEKKIFRNVAPLPILAIAVIVKLLRLI